MSYDTPDHNMEMPTPCRKCNKWFDLNDGIASEKWFSNTVICDECGALEKKVIELEDEIDYIENDIADAEHTLTHGKIHLAKLRNELWKLINH